MAYTRVKTWVPGEALTAADYESNFDAWRDYCNRNIAEGDLVSTTYLGAADYKAFTVNSFQKPDISLFGINGVAMRQPSTTTVWNTQNVLEYVPANPASTLDPGPPVFHPLTDNSGAKNLTGNNGILSEVYHKTPSGVADGNTYKNLPKSGLSFYLQEDAHVFVKCHLDVFFFKTAREDGLAVSSRRNVFKIMFDQASDPDNNNGALFSGGEQVETQYPFQRRHIVLQADLELDEGWHDVSIVTSCISRFGVVGGSGIMLETFQKRPPPG